MNLRTLLSEEGIPWYRGSNQSIPLASFKGGVMLTTPIPDLDAALVTFLDNHADLIPLHGGRVSTHVLDSTLPRLRVTALGGTQPWPWEATGEYQIDAWGGTEAQAYTLASTVCAAIYDMRGAITGGRIVTAEPSLRPISAPDEDTGRPRYLVQVLLAAMVGA